MDLLGCMAALAAMVLAYLSSPNQRFRRTPLGRAARITAWALGVAALIAWVTRETALPGIFAALTALMFGAVILPYITWFFRPATGRKPR